MSSSNVGRTIGTSDKFTLISSSVSGDANLKVFDCAARDGRCDTVGAGALGRVAGAAGVRRTCEAGWAALIRFLQVIPVHVERPQPSGSAALFA